MTAKTRLAWNGIVLSFPCSLATCARVIGLDGSKFGLDDLVQQVPIENRRSDGVFSGASLERPALQQLLVDVGAGKIDIVLPLDMPKLLSIAAAQDRAATT
jgi:hypothetical protein